MKPTRIWPATILLLAWATAAAARPPRAELVGLRLGMPEGEAQARLAKLGTRTAEKPLERESEEQESWSLRHGPWGYVSFGVEAGRVLWVTAFGRREGPRVRYRDLGSLAECRRSGTYFFTWKVPPRRKAAAYTVIARGADSVYVGSVSLLGSAGRSLPEPPSDPDKR